MQYLQRLLESLRSLGIAGVPEGHPQESLVVMVNTTFTQEWLDNALARRRPGDPMSLILPRQMADDQDFFEQVLNERFDPEKGTWVRIDETTVPVDFRDCVRYARAAAEIYCNGNWTRIPESRPVPIKTRQQRQEQQTKAATKTTKRTGFVRKSGKRFVRRRQ